MNSSAPVRPDRLTERGVPRGKDGDRPAPKLKKCRICRRSFAPFLSTQVCCSTACAIAHARLSPQEKREKQERQIANAEKRERKAALKTRKDWLREAQAVFNAMIRERDYFKPCISCGARIMTVENGGVWDAGHFRSVGAAPELRFEPLNCHKQCKTCNGGTMRKGSQVYVQPWERSATIHQRYRVNLIERIGLQQVEWLESYHEPLKPTAEWLQTKIREWRAETRRMRVAREARAA